MNDGIFKSIELEGFKTRHLLDIQFADLSGLSQLINWLSDRQARVHHCVVRAGDGMEYSASLSIERIRADTLMDRLKSDPSVLSRKIEHMLINETERKS